MKQNNFCISHWAFYFFQEKSTCRYVILIGFNFLQFYSVPWTELLMLSDLYMRKARLEFIPRSVCFLRIFILG